MDSVAQRLSAVGAGAALELRGVTRLFGALAAITDVTITVRPGERRAVRPGAGSGQPAAWEVSAVDFQRRWPGIVLTLRRKNPDTDEHR